MVNITHKTNSLRQAIASAIVTVSKFETITAIQNKTVAKGDVFEFSRAAGLLAIKKTSDVIPDCHPLPIEFATIKHTIDGLKTVMTDDRTCSQSIRAVHGIGDFAHISSAARLTVKQS